MLRRSAYLLASLISAVACQPQDRARTAANSAANTGETVSRFAAFALDSAVTAAPPCTGASAQEATADALPSLAGAYLLTLVATEGSRQGARAHGRFWVYPTSAGDRSPRTGRGPAHPDSDVRPYFGATDLDFAAVGAPMEWSDTLDPPKPTSRDPIYPGVLSSRLPLLDSADAPGVPRFTFMVGTLSNRRDDLVGLDGPGIGLFVQEASAEGITGRWGPWGRKYDGRGYFCLRRVGSARRAV